jgi:acid phosphatase (class A)
MNREIECLTESNRHSRVVVTLTVWLWCAVAAPLFAQSNYFVPGHLNADSLLAPPPEPGSAEEAADLATVRSVFGSRTPAEEARAVKDSSLSFSLFSPATGARLELKQQPKLQALLAEVKAEIGKTIDSSKDHWKRHRPYQMDEHLQLGEPEPSFSYPSGHSTRGTVYALVLSEVFPENREAILAFGRQIGWDRIVIGKHFPTDVYAGRVLGQAIFHELMASPAFQKDLATARAELQTAQVVGH